MNDKKNIMSDKKRFPNERPEDVQRILREHIYTIDMIRTLLDNAISFNGYTKGNPYPQSFNTIIKGVLPESTKCVLKKAIESLELLSGYITEELEPEVEALSGDLTESYDANKELHRENQRLEAENQYLKDDKFRVVMECTERYKEIRRLKNLLDASIKNTNIWKNSYFSAIKERNELREKLSNSEKMLKAAVSKIDNLEYAKNKENKNSLYGICASVIRLNPVNDGSNFCGNCRYCVQLMTGKYACRIPIPDRIIDPDSSSCQYFKQPYDTRTDQEVCAECDKKDTEHCKKCPLFPF